MSGTVWHRFWGAYLCDTPNYNGVARFVPQLQRITIKFCKHRSASLGTREFIERDLLHFAESNPHVVVYLKPRRHRTPAIVAEYLNGGCEYQSLYRASREDVLKWMEHFKNRSGRPTMKLLKLNHTDHLSIQGTWTPWVHRPANLLNTEYPNEELSKAIKFEKTATDQLLELAAKRKSSRDGTDAAASSTQAT